MGLLIVSDGVSISMVLVEGARSFTWAERNKLEKMQMRIQFVWVLLLAGCAAVCAGQSQGQSQPPTPTQSQTNSTSDQNAAQKKQQGQANTPPAAPQPSAAAAFPFPEEQSRAAAEAAKAASVPDSPGLNGLPPGFSSSKDGAQPDTPDTGTDATGTDKNAATKPVTPTGRHKMVLPHGHVYADQQDRADDDLSVADLYQKDGNYRGAYLRYQDAVKSDPDDPAGHYGWAEMARKLNKPDEAVEQYNAYLKLDPNGKKASAARKALGELQATAKK